MDVKEAVQTAKKYIAELFTEETITNVGLEEVEFNDTSNNWEVTIGFSRPWQTNLLSSKTIDSALTHPASCRLWLVAFDFNLTLAFLCSRDVVGGLQAYPGLRRGAERFGKPDCHLGRHARTTIDQVRKGLATDAKDLGTFSHAQTKRLQTSGAHDLSGVRRVLHGHWEASSVYSTRSCRSGWMRLGSLRSYIRLRPRCRKLCIIR